jgi:hypothetical protein
VELGPYEFLFDKWHLGPLRLLNFAAVAALLIVMQSLLKPLAVRPLILMGQSSLQVFCVHLLFCFAGLTLLGNASMLTGRQQLGLIAATLTAMLITAKLFSKSEAKHERQPKPEGTLGAMAGPNLRPQTDPASETVPPAADPLPAAVTPAIDSRSSAAENEPRPTLPAETPPSLVTPVKRAFLLPRSSSDEELAPVGGLPLERQRRMEPR